MRARSLLTKARPCSESGTRNTLYVVPRSAGSNRITSPKLRRVNTCFQKSTAPCNPAGTGNGVTRAQTATGKRPRAGKMKNKENKYRDIGSG